MVDRILLVLKIKNLTPSKFADEIGIQRSSMSHIMSGRNLPSLDLIMKILSKYPDINSEWLLQGVGPMLRTNQIDLFEPLEEVKKSEPSLFQPTGVKPEIGPLKEEIKESIPEKVEEKKIVQDKNEPEIVEKHDVKPVFHVEKETEKEIQTEIEKIVILYKNKTFKEYYPG